MPLSLLRVRWRSQADCAGVQICEPAGLPARDEQPAETVAPGIYQESLRLN